MILCFLCSKCVAQLSESMVIESLPIHAQLEGDILTGLSILNDPNRFVWGGSVIQGNDGKYHMLYSTWVCGDSIPPFSTSWVLYSEIAYAISDYPDRDFQFQKVVLRGRNVEGDSTAWDAQMVHNPHVKRFDDKYYLYYTGSVDPGVQPSRSNGAQVDLRNRVQQNQKIGVIEFESFDELVSNQFERPSLPILAPRTRVKPNNIVDPSPTGTKPKPDNIIVVNPSVVRRPSDGKYLLYFKGNLYDPHWKGIHGVAIGDRPTGPFIARDEIIFNFKLDDGKIASAEDPYVWYHQTHEKFYAVFKDFTGKITNNNPGLAILESSNGLDWMKPLNPFFMPKELHLTTGDTIKVQHLERPQLLIDDQGYPKVLYAACSLINVASRQDGSSFNVQVPIAIR